MMGWFKRRSGRLDIEVVPPPAEPLTQKQQDEELLAIGTCPDCQTPQSMRLGPAGCSANNCMCIACRHEWNLLLFNAVTILEDMGRADEDRARTIYGWKMDTATPTREPV